MFIHFPHVFYISLTIFHQCFFLQCSLSVSISEPVCSLFIKFLACRHSDALDVLRFVQTRFLFSFLIVKQEKDVRSGVMGLWVILTLEKVHGRHCTMSMDHVRSL